MAVTSFDHAFPHARLSVVDGRLVERFGRGQVQLFYPRAECLLEFIDAPDQPGKLVPPRAIIEVSLAIENDDLVELIRVRIPFERLAKLSLNLCPMGRDKISLNKPANSGPVSENWEISASARIRGGPGLKPSTKRL